MERLCGRPGCSDPASVAYGMQAEDLVFWLDHLPDVPDTIGGVLCRRHADSMVVPRGWTLDDRRDPELHLFRPPQPYPPSPGAKTTRSARIVRPVTPRVEQLELGASDPSADVVAHATPAELAPPADDGATPAPWTPDFDETDDLDGLLSASSPLLARAFRTVDRNVPQG